MSAALCCCRHDHCISDCLTNPEMRPLRRVDKPESESSQ
ncbi:hypothetical protein GFS60_06199 [Rhodococcus sp. WAY2]|nr:hypothetical protein GFS60_06199 [Rhodococcus sp. WAY2]